MNLQNQVMVFDAKTKSFSPELQEVTELAGGEVLVRIRCCTICGSDLHTWSGRRAGPARCVLGHEIVGEVVDWGGERPPLDYFGNAISTGQRITWNMAVGCGKCFFCRRGLQQKCERLFKYGHEFDDARAATGGLGQYCRLVAGTAIFPLPDSLPDQVATPANCATATVCAATRLIGETHPLPGATALVVGLGMLGLTAVARLADLGAANILAFDLDPDRAELARRFGATHVVSSADQVGKAVQSLTDSRGADIVMDFAGVPAAVQASIRHARVGGCVLLAGSVFPTGEIAIDPESFVRRMLTVRGLHNYLPVDLKDALEFLERTHPRYPFAELVSKSYELANVANAFKFAADQSPVRIAIVGKTL